MMIGMWYVIWVIPVEPGDAGHDGVARPRVYVLCLHRSKGFVICDPDVMYNSIKTATRSQVKTLPRDYCVATPREVEVSAMQLACSRHIIFQPVTRLT